MGKKKNITEICGEVIDIVFDDKVEKLNSELAISKEGAPLIILQDWTNDRSKTLLKLHLKEAIELKAVFEKLILDATLHSREHVEELMNEPFDN